jgi:cell division protein FtsQ
MAGLRRPVRPAEGIDPRLRERRDEVAQARIRRRRRVVATFAVLLLLAVGAWFLVYRSPVLDVDRVTVSGNHHTSTAELQRAAGVARGTALVSVDLAAVRRRVEAEPWVQGVTVGRRWPGTVRVQVIERTPVAITGGAGGHLLVDRTGRVLAPAPAKTALPLLASPAAKPGAQLSQTAQRVTAVIGDLPPELRSQVMQAGSTSAGLTFTLTGGVKVRWGDDQATAAKAQSLLLLLAKADRATIASIDVSVPSAAALTREAGPVA